MSWPETVQFGLANFELKKFSIREPEGDEDFSQALPMALDFGWAKEDDSDSVARLRIQLTISSKPEIIDLQEPAMVALELVAVSSVELVDGGVPTPHFASTDLPLGVKAMVLGIGIGTLRGVLISRSAGFTLAQQQMPVLNPSEMLEARARGEG